MIKLNNKNITYVALADSNNSLKAPKEIWYADSNNSVKLVYRRKDALIEGEDYEKYHWLKGDGTAYIDTGIIVPTEKFVCVTRLRNRETRTEPNSFLAFTVRQQSVANFPFISVNPRTDEQRYYVDLTNPRSYVPFGSGAVDINITMSSANNLQGDLMFFRSKNLSFGNSPWIGDISAFSLTSLDSTFSVEMQPVRLLKSVPKWLDANGIRRQVGECGMIDLVSGKFYGNVNSVGTFTVENYYERKEWLCGRNGAYIDTNYYPIVGTDVFSVHFHYGGTKRNPDGGEQDVFGVNYNDSNERNFIRAFINSGNYLSCSYYKYIDRYPTTGIQSNEWNIDDLSINNSQFQYSANGVSYSYDNNGIQLQVCPYPLFVFKNNDQVFNQNCYLHGDISSFKITDNSSNTKMSLIPCTLTMDLPASMDANNIARTKGTSGMWDLVSDRFYGNVANSGTFKAVNLAEGVDYEVHQWLKTGSGYPHIQVDYNCNTDNGAYIETRYKCNYSNPGFDMLIGVSINQNNNIGIRIFNTTNGISYGTYVDYHKTENGVFSSSRTIQTQSNINAERYIKATLNNLIIDTTEYPSINWDSGFDNINRQGTILYTNQGDNDMHYAETKLRVNNVEHDLIPVKLLRSIPSQYDANGIARKAGECGMYDTVNDVFYGNVVSSGTFSVSDDS